MNPFDIMIDFRRYGKLYSIPMISHVQDGLYLGGARAWRLMDLPARFTRVVRLTGEHAWGLPAGVAETAIPIRDHRDQDLSAVWQAAEWIAGLDATVLVHCQMGLNRSAAVMARALMIRNEWTADEAITHLRETRSPVVLFNESFVDQLGRL